MQDVDMKGRMYGVILLPKYLDIKLSLLLLLLMLKWHGTEHQTH